jgi:hypothetical protein
VSDHYLRIIPRDPDHLPPARAQEKALAVLRTLVPRAEEVRAIVQDEVSFVDQGGNLEEIRCPRCRATLEPEWWMTEMDRAHATRFADLSLVVPCCGARSSLNDLDYDWPAGFARFVLQVREPGLAGWLDDAAVARLEKALGAPVRQIRARY